MSLAKRKIEERLVNGHLKDTSEVDNRFLDNNLWRDIVVVGIKVILVVILGASLFLFGGMYGAHKAANDPEFVKEYTTATADEDVSGR